MTLEVTVTLSGSVLDSEKTIQSALNEAVSPAICGALKRFDMDDERLDIDGKMARDALMPEAKETINKPQSRPNIAPPTRVMIAAPGNSYAVTAM